ncbi:hypothetical protein [Arthrobacter sp. SLBN-112]|nr:hypothetical protein [Arthrobacter sp. SLBN-112]
MTGGRILRPAVDIYSHLTEISFKSIIGKSWKYEPGVQDHQYE